MPVQEHHAFVKDAMDRPLNLGLDSVIRYIAYYNPTVKQSTGENTLLRKARNAYYHNEHFFSRLLIIYYIEWQNEETRIDFVKEYFGISELYLRVQMIGMLNRTGYTAHAEDTFFFTALCQDIGSEIIWTESAINDIKDEVGEPLLTALKTHISTLRNLLFELLKILYDKDSIQVVQDILRSKDDSLENRLFAIELLDNVLETQMKKLVMPVIEDSSYNAKKERLGKILLFYHLPCADRLKEILMANYMTVGPYIKELALLEYYQKTGDKTILTAYAASFVENLNATAIGLLNDTDQKIQVAKLTAVEELNLTAELTPNILAYFIKWGLFSRERKKTHVGVNEYLGKQTYQFNEDMIKTIKVGNTNLSVDELALSLILKAEQH